MTSSPPLPDTPALDVVEALAMRFHEVYERLAPEFSYKTRKASAVPWAEVPSANKQLMRAVAAEILASPAALLSASAETARLREERDEFERRSDEWQNKYVEEAFAEEGAAPVLWSTVAERLRERVGELEVQRNTTFEAFDAMVERAEQAEGSADDAEELAQTLQQRLDSTTVMHKEEIDRIKAAWLRDLTEAIAERDIYSSQLTEWHDAHNELGLKLEETEALLAEAREMISYAARNGSHAVELACDDFLLKLTPTDPAGSGESESEHG